MKRIFFRFIMNSRFGLGLWLPELEYSAVVLRAACMFVSIVLYYCTNAVLATDLFASHDGSNVDNCFAAFCVWYS